MRRNHLALGKIVPDMISHLTEHVSISVMTPLSGSTKLSSIHLPLTQIGCFGALGFFWYYEAFCLVWVFFSFIFFYFLAPIEITEENTFIPSLLFQ